MFRFAILRLEPAMDMTIDDIQELDDLSAAEEIVAARTVFDADDGAYSTVYAAFGRRQIDGTEPHIVQVIVQESRRGGHSVPECVGSCG